MKRLLHYTEELSLDVVQKAQGGDQKALRELVEFCQPRIVKEARRYKGVTPFEERMSAGYEGLMRGLRKFNPRVDKNFWKYVFFHVRAYMIKEVKGSRTTQRWILGEFSPDAVGEGLIAGVRKFDDGRWDNGIQLEKVGMDDPAFQAHEDVEQLQSDFGKVKRMVAECLSIREQDVIQRRLAGETLQGIGDSLGISREYVRQLELKAHQKLRVG